MDFMKMFMDCINVDAINNLTDEQLKTIEKIFEKTEEQD